MWLELVSNLIAAFNEYSEPSSSRVEVFLRPTCEVLKPSGFVDIISAAGFCAEA
jgi:hypothetical protein